MKKELKPYLRILIGRRNLLRLSGAAIGSLLGFFILMVAIQLWSDARFFMQNDDDDLFAPGLVVINKKLSVLNTLGMADPAFSDQEIQEIRDQPFVNRAEPFIPCGFKVSVSFAMSGVQIPNLISEFFFESVPDELVDMAESVWRWDEGSDFVPVVLPADFLKFYNFGFAPGQNLPQLSEKTLRMATLRIRIDGGADGAVMMKGKIVGLSEKINTILVPHTFMSWANEHYGDQRPHRPTRLVIVSRTTADPDLAAFIRNNQYETGGSELRSGKLNQLLQASLLVTGVIGLIIILLALYLFILSFSLFIVRSDYEIRTLIQLGIHPNVLIRYLLGMLVTIVAIIFLSDSLLLHFLHRWASLGLQTKGIGIMANTHWVTYLLASLLMVFLVVVNYINIRRNIHRIAG